jgi:uncharacterized protein
MKKAKSIAALFVMGLAMVSCVALAQAPTAQLANKPAAALTVVPAPIPADQQSTKEQLTKMFELMRIREQVASLTEMMPALMQQQMTAQMKQMKQDHPEMASVTEEEQQATTEIMSKSMERAANLYPFDEMLADMTGLYQKYMTRSDVDGIIAFYSSPAGQHLLDMQPAILQEYLPLVMQRMQDRIKTVTGEMTKELMASIKTKAPDVNKPTQK